MLSEAASIITIFEFFIKIFKNDKKEIDMTAGIEDIVGKFKNNKISSKSEIFNEIKSINDIKAKLFSQILLLGFEEDRNVININQHRVFWSDFINNFLSSINLGVQKNFKTELEYLSYDFKMSRTNIILRNIIGFKFYYLLPLYNKLHFNLSLHNFDYWMLCFKSNCYSYVKVIFIQKADEFMINKNSKNHCFTISDEIIPKIITNIILDITENILTVSIKHQKKMGIINNLNYHDSENE